MMKKRSFAILVGLLIFLVLVFILVIVLVAPILGPNFVSRTYQDGAAGESKEISTPPAELDYFRQLQGTEYFIAEITEGGDRRNSGSSSWFSYSYNEASVVRNFVFLNSKTLVSRMLLDTNEYTMIGMLQYPESVYTSSSSDCEPETIVVEWLIYRIAKEDTNLDGRIDGEDMLTIATSDASGSRYLELLDDIERLYMLEIMDDGRLLAVYQQRAEDYASVIDLDEQEIVELKPLVEWSFDEQ